MPPVSRFRERLGLESPEPPSRQATARVGSARSGVLTEGAGGRMVLPPAPPTRQIPSSASFAASNRAKSLRELRKRGFPKAVAEIALRITETNGVTDAEKARKWLLEHPVQVAAARAAQGNDDYLSDSDEDEEDRVRNATRMVVKETEKLKGRLATTSQQMRDIVEEHDHFMRNFAGDEDACLGDKLRHLEEAFSAKSGEAIGQTLESLDKDMNSLKAAQRVRETALADAKLLKDDWEEKKRRGQRQLESLEIQAKLMKNQIDASERRQVQLPAPSNSNIAPSSSPLIPLATMPAKQLQIVSPRPALVRASEQVNEGPYSIPSMGGAPTELQVRLLNGSVVQSSSFTSRSTLQQVYDWLKSLRSGPTARENVKFVRAAPHRVFPKEEWGAVTIESAEVCRGQLILAPA